MKYKLTIETPDDVLTIQCNNIESVKRFADCVAGFILPECNQDASDGDDWTPWPGGECPVPRDALVDVRYRDGYVLYGVKALRTFSVRSENGSVYGVCNVYWINDNSSSDIIAYRLHKSEEQK